MRCSFDGTVTPEHQVGEKGGAFAGNGVATRFVPGLRGEAVVLAHEQGVRLPLAGNLRVEEGTISFWVQPLDWSIGDKRFHHFLQVPQPPADAARAEGRPFSVTLYQYWEWDNIIAYGMDGELTAENLLAVPMDDTWRPGRWHHVAFAWDREGAALYVDGTEARHGYKGAAPSRFGADAITLGGPYFEPNETRTALDDLAVYGRRLTAREIRRQHAAGARLAKGP